MAVLIEAYDLVIRNAAVESRFPDGLIAFEAYCPNNTFCTDGQVCRIGFQVPGDLSAFVVHLREFGFLPPGPDGCPEMAIVDAWTGLRFPCDWLTVEEVHHEGGSLTVALVPGTDPSAWIAPERWTSSPTTRVERAHVEDLQYVGLVPDSNVQAFVHRKTGEIVFTGRVFGSAAGPSELEILRHEMAYLLTLEGRTPGSAREQVGTCFQRARTLTMRAEWDQVAAPLHMAGVFARLLANWKQAENILRRLTVLDPGHLEGWLELTVVLAHRRRFRQAEEAARTALALAPGDGRTLGNLAGVLGHLGKLDEARAVAVQAIQAAPADRKNRWVLAQIEEAARRRANPWWRRFWPLSAG